MLLGSLGLLRVFLVIVVVIVLAFAEMSGVLNQLIRQRCFLALRQLVFLQRGWLVALEQILGRRGGLRLLLLLFLASVVNIVVKKLLIGRASSLTSFSAG